MIEGGKNKRRVKGEMKKQERNFAGSLKTKACSPKLKPLPLFSPKRRRTSLKQALV